MLTFFMLIGIQITALAQEHTISTDRPTQSDEVATVPKNKIQLEEGLNLAEKTMLNNLLIRYGVTNSTELRLLVDAGKASGVEGLQPITFSLKQHIIDQNGVIPAISFVGYLSCGALASSNYKSSQWPFQLKFSFANGLTDKLSLGYNIGTSDEFKQLNLTCMLGYACTDRLSLFGEYFSSVKENYSNHNIDAGFIYLINSTLQADLAFGHAIFSSENRFYTSLGISILL